MVSSILKKTSKDVKHEFLKYTAGLILTSGRKTCVNMARSLDISHDQIYKSLESDEPLAIPNLLIDIVQSLPSSKNGWLIIDDTLISKRFAKLIEGITYEFNVLTGKSELSVSIVVIAWTDGTTVIPIDFDFWLNKEIMGSNYHTKKELAQILIARIYPLIKCKGVIMDGLYSSKDMIIFLNNLGINFEMRIATNRIIETHFTKAQLKHHPELKFRKNDHSRTIQATWQGIKNLYFTAEKKANKYGEFVIAYSISNMQTSPYNHVFIYSQRWGIEMFFRTSKQYLGLSECQSRSLSKQKAHILNIFYSYSFLQCKRLKSKDLNVESTIYCLRNVNTTTLIKQMSSLDQVFSAVA